MALDGVLLRHIKNEISLAALGGKVSQVYQPNKDEIVLQLRTQQGNKKLLLSARANSPRVHFTEFAPENPQTPPMLCMLFRKLLCGAKLCDIRQIETERILFFDFEATNEIGDRINLTLVAEIMGKYSNIILVNGDNVIVDALKRVDLTMSSQRLVLPNLKYELPPAQEKLSPLTNSAEDILNAVLDMESEKPLDKAILSVVLGVSPIVCRELSSRISSLELTNKTLLKQDKETFLSEVTKFICDIKEYRGVPTTVFREQQKPYDVTFLPITQYGEAVTTKTFESYSQMLDMFYYSRDSLERMRVKSHDLLKLVSNTIDRLSRKINVQSAELSKCTDREHLRIKGDLLQANLYRIERGQESVTVDNFYDEENAPITIELNPAISPAANAQKFYKDYSKAKTAEKMLTEQIEKAQNELVYLNSVLDCLNRCQNEKELSQIRLELVEQGYIKAPKGKQKQPKVLPPLEFVTSDGFKIAVGRNNKQNDLLTLKTASKNDVWFHTKNIPGSHTIVFTEGKEITDTAILEAAQICAYYSKAKDSSGVPVDFTQVRYVSKPQGAKPGMVIYVNNKTVYVTPKNPETK